MKRQTFLNRLYTLLLVAAAATLVSCSDDDDNPGRSAIIDNHVGNWFLDWSTPEKKMWCEMDFLANGTFNYAVVNSSIKEGVSQREKMTSTYRKEGNTLVCRFDWATTGTQSTERIDITYSDKYTLVLNYSQTGSEETYSRIVDEYYIRVGETVQFEFKDSEFDNATYNSTDKRIATVDDNGLITAVRHGTTYITARAGVGAVTIKVNVIDTEQPYTEYGEDLTLNRQQIIAKYGNNYMDLKETNSIAYYLGDMDTEAVNFRFTNHDKVKTIIVSLWEPTYLTSMTEFLEGKYEQIIKDDDGFNAFINNNGKCNYYVYTDLTDLLNGYERILPDFERYDDLVVTATADEFAAQFGYTITEQDGGLCMMEIGNGNMYEYAVLLYDEQTRDISMVEFLCKDGRGVKEVTEMVKEFYPYYMDGYGYCSTEYWWTLSPIVFVEVEENIYGGISVKYSKLKNSLL